MNYNSLFNLLYSIEISEATKDEIISKIEESIEESTEVEALAETYMELLDTLVFSTASEELIDNIIDETFSSLDEEFINEVSDEWVKRKVQDSMAARRAAADSANKSVKSGVIGLSQIRRQDKAQQDLAKGEAKSASIQARLDKKNPNPQPKAEGAMGKLKSAVGKVKKWASAEGNTAPVGLSRIIGAKANKDNIGASALHDQTTHKTSSSVGGTTNPAPQKSRKERMEELKAKYRKSAQEEPKKNENPLADPTLKAMQRHENKLKKEEVQKKKEEKNSISASLERAFKFKDKPKQEEPKKEEKPEVKSEVKTEEPKKEEVTNKELDKDKRHQQLSFLTKRGQIAKKYIQKDNGKPSEVPAETKKEEIKQEKPKRNRRQRIENVVQQASNKTKGNKQSKVKTEEVKPAGNKTGEVKSEIKANDATEAAKENKTNTPKVETSDGKPTNKPAVTNTKSATNAKKTVVNAIAKPAENNKPEENKSAEQKYLERVMRLAKIGTANELKNKKDALENLRTQRTGMTSKPGWDPKALQDLDDRIAKLEKELGATKTNEALSDLAILLLNTNISESCFVEVLEMAGANKTNALKVKDRYEHDMSAVLNDLNKELEEKKSIDPENLKKAEELAKRKDHFEEMFNKKFNDNN